MIVRQQPGLNVYGTAVGGELDGVIEQEDQYLPETRLVGLG